MKIQGKIINSLLGTTGELGCELDLGKAETPIQRIAGISPWTSSHYQKDIASLQTHPSAYCQALQLRRDLWLTLY